MTDKSRIEWTDATWNPVTGCTKVSSGCDHCYAKTMHERFNGPGSFDTVTLRPERLDQPLRWRKPRRVFVNSMSDLFHDDVLDDYIARIFAVMALAPQHTFQVLTKRHGRMRSLLNSEEFKDRVNVEYWTFDPKRPAPEQAWPLLNVWLGVSVENQQWADIRIPALLDTPATVRFLSCEPLLGPACLDAFHSPDGHSPGTRLPCEVWPGGIDWVIVGGESGRGARPMHPDWARSLRDQCTAAGVAFHFKQWGEWVTEDQSPQDITLPATGWHHLGDSEPTVYKVGKHAAGRELDGRTWDEFPNRMAVGS